MKTLKIFSCLFLAASLFASCSSESDLIEEPQKPEVPEIDYSKLTFTEFGIDIKTIAGETGTRSAADVDEKGRPLARYPLSTIYLVSTSDGGQNIEMNLKVSTKAECAFINVNDPSDIEHPTHAIIRPRGTEQGVSVALSTMQLREGTTDVYDAVTEGGRFYYMSQKNGSTISLPKNSENMYTELGDKLFKSEEFLLTYDAKKKLVAYQTENNMGVAYPAKGTDVGGLWPIYVNRVSAAMSIRYMVSGDYYDLNKGMPKGEERNAAMERAFETETGFPMSAMYTDEAYMSGFPISCVFANSIVPEYKNAGNLLIYNKSERVDNMTEIIFNYNSTEKSRGAMGLAATAVPFTYPVTFSKSQHIHIFVGVKTNNKDVRMHFKLEMPKKSIAENTNTLFYLTMTTKELKAFYEQALNTPSTRSGEVVFELPSSHLAVSTTPEMAN